MTSGDIIIVKTGIWSIGPFEKFSSISSCPVDNYLSNFY